MNAIITMAILLLPALLHAFDPCDGRAMGDVCWVIVDLEIRDSSTANTMSDDDCRNTLIVELSKVTSESIPQIQGYGNADLIGKMYAAKTLMQIGSRTAAQLATYSTDDTRNTLIVENSLCVADSIASLQGDTDTELSCLVIGMMDSKTIAWEVSGVSFDLDSASMVAQTPLAIGSATCDNLHGGTATHWVQFAVSETFEDSSTFSRTHGFEISIGAKFETGIPFIANGEVSTTLSTSHSWTFGETNTEIVTRSGTFHVTCDPGQRIVGTASVHTANLDVPFTMSVKGKYPACKHVSRTVYGTWQGVTAWDLRITYSS